MLIGCPPLLHQRPEQALHGAARNFNPIASHIIGETNPILILISISELIVDQLYYLYFCVNYLTMTLKLRQSSDWNFFSYFPETVKHSVIAVISDEPQNYPIL